jgi:hypothetical protein
VLISAVEALLKGAHIDHLVADQNMRLDWYFSAVYRIGRSSESKVCYNAPQRVPTMTSPLYLPTGRLHDC